MGRVTGKAGVFERIWVVQKVALASQRVGLFGNYTFPWELSYDMYDAFNPSGLLLSDSIELSQWTSHFYRATQYLTVSRALPASWSRMTRLRCLSSSRRRHVCNPQIRDNNCLQCSACHLTLQNTLQLTTLNLLTQCFMRTPQSWP
jgi:hypothetical protein